MFTSQSRTRLFGAFDLRRWVAWHDDSVSAGDAFGTVVHEELHATAIAGSALHASMVHDLFAGEQPGAGRLQAPAYRDYFHFHEAVPKAFDLLTGLTTSAYTDPAIVELARRLAELSRTVSAGAAGALPLEDPDPDSTIALRGIALAISDGFETPEQPTTASLLDVLSDALARDPGRAWPQRFDATRPLTHQVRANVSEILVQELGRPTWTCSYTELAIRMFNDLAGLVLEGETGLRRIAPLFLSLVNLLFPGVSTPHLVFDPKARRLYILTSGICARRMQVASAEALHAIDDKLTASHRARLYSDEVTYVYESFMLKHVFEESAVPFVALHAYLNQQWAAFPTALVGICDAVLQPTSSDALRERDAVLERLHAQESVLVETPGRYHELREAVWAALMRVVPRLPFLIAGEFELMVRPHVDAGLCAFDLDAGPLLAFLGLSPFASLSVG